MGAFENLCALFEDGLRWELSTELLSEIFIGLTHRPMAALHCLKLLIREGRGLPASVIKRDPSNGRAFMADSFEKIIKILKIPQKRLKWMTTHPHENTVAHIKEQTNLVHKKELA